MAEQNAKGGIRERLSAQTEDALGKLAQDLLENPVINGAIARAFDARERASQAQEVAMGALNLPSASDVERLTRRLRSVSQRLEGIEDVLDRLERRLGALSADEAGAARLAGVEEQLSLLTRTVADLGEHLPGTSSPVPQAQERLAVEADPAPAAAPRKRAAKPRKASPAKTSRSGSAGS
jgi:hypothetical protein